MVLCSGCSRWNCRLLAVGTSGRDWTKRYRTRDHGRRRKSRRRELARFRRCFAGKGSIRQLSFQRSEEDHGKRTTGRRLGPRRGSHDARKVHTTSNEQRATSNEEQAVSSKRKQQARSTGDEQDRRTVTQQGHLSAPGYLSLPSSQLAESTVPKSKSGNVSLRKRLARLKGNEWLRHQAQLGMPDDCELSDRDGTPQPIILDGQPRFAATET